jgi:hypothetical protein
LKNPTTRQSRPRTRLNDSQKQTIRDHFCFLRDQWCQTLEADPLDRQHLFDLHWELYKLEHQHPWLKKAVA